MARPSRVGLATAIAYRQSGQILTPARGFMAAYDFVLNPYAGCGFGCDYCYARAFAPTRDQSETWGSWLAVKQNAVDLIRRAGRSRSEALVLRPGRAVYMSSVTDPYQPIERDIGLTRDILQVLLDYQPRLTIQTRSPLVTRDIDLLQQFEHLRVNLTITTDDDEVRRRYEPFCPSIEQRFAATRALRDAGIPIGISISPMLPIGDALAFGRRLRDLGATEYVSQYFKTEGMRFRAGSSASAMLRAREDKWLVEQYGTARDLIQEGLGTENRLLEGEEGYAPA